MAHALLISSLKNLQLSRIGIQCLAKSYSNTVSEDREEFKIPFGETQDGKSACQSGNPYCLGGIGVTGTYASNIIGKDADVESAVVDAYKLNILILEQMLGAC